MDIVSILIGLVVVVALLVALPLAMLRTARRPFLLVRLDDPRDSARHYPDPAHPERCVVCRRIYPCPDRAPYEPPDKVTG